MTLISQTQSERYRAPRVLKFVSNSLKKRGMPKVGVRTADNNNVAFGDQLSVYAVFRPHDRISQLSASIAKC